MRWLSRPVKRRASRCSLGLTQSPLQAGAAARAGIETALLAQAGCDGNLDVLCAPRGVAGLMGDREPDRINAEARRLGAPWALAEHGVMLKPWPSCGYTHRLMTAALELRERLGPASAAASEIIATLPDFHRVIVPFDAPENRNEALFSAPACVAQVLLDGTLTLQDGADEFWRRTGVRELAERVTVVAEPARRPHMNYDPKQPDRLALTLGGRQHVADCAYPLGAPQNPMSAAQLARKFTDMTGLPEQRHADLMGLGPRPRHSRPRQGNADMKRSGGTRRAARRTVRRRRLGRAREGGLARRPGRTVPAAHRR